MGRKELIQCCKPQFSFFLRLHVQPSTVSQNTRPAGELQSPKCKASSFNVKTKQTRVGVSSKQSSLLVKHTAKALRSIRAPAALKWTKPDPRQLSTLRGETTRMKTEVWKREEENSENRARHLGWNCTSPLNPHPNAEAASNKSLFEQRKCPREHKLPEFSQSPSQRRLNYLKAPQSNIEINIRW